MQAISTNFAENLEDVIKKNLPSLKVDLFLVPALIIGFWAGIKIVGRINDQQFRKVVIALTLIGSVLMLLR